VPEGKTLSLTQQGVPFDLRLERFAIDYYSDSQAVRQYRSDVVLTRAGQELRRGSLEVNEPLSYAGAKIFQMSYGWLVEGSVRQLPDGKVEPFSLTNGGWLDQLGPDKDRLRAVIVTDPDKHSSRPPEVAFVLLKESGTRQTAVVAQGVSVKDSKVEIRFDRLRRYSGLQVKQDPGIVGIFAGLSLSLFGLMLRYVPLGGKKAV
jgi:cytochrome c biogenesis protein